MEKGFKMCRLKLLKNKRRCIVKQVREDVAQLLKHGHHQSAFQRVEQLIMDENMIQVYDLLDQFCEFIVLNLPYIRRHRDCPNDINEAVSTLIFSSARFGELPELLPIRKLFGERYNQRFVTIALELLPGNLVNNQIKENLYIKKASDDVKYRFLDEIARTCIQSGPFLLEYKPQLQHDQIMWTDNLQHFDNVQEIDSSSENSSKLIYLDDIEEFVQPSIKDGDLQDQRLFMFRSFGSQEMSLSRSTDIQCAIYYGGSGEASPDKNRRKSCFKTGEKNHACNSDNALVTITLPSREKIERSISFPCPHIHPKLPDYDELAAKFMELKRANIVNQNEPYLTI